MINFNTQFINRTAFGKKTTTPSISTFSQNTSNDVFVRSNKKIAFNGVERNIALATRVSELIVSSKPIFEDKQSVLIGAFKDKSGRLNESRIAVAEAIAELLNSNTNAKEANKRLSLPFVLKNLENQQGDIPQESIDGIKEIFGKEKSPNFHIISMVFDRLLKDDKGNISPEKLATLKGLKD